jgi:hypothetical protein
MPEDKIDIKILEDGTISVDTESFTDGEVHFEAEAFLKETFAELGGDKKIIKQKPHTHAHGHTHTHQHGGH